MKVVSTVTELSVLRSVCVRDPKISGTLLAGMDTEYFHNDYTKAIYGHIVAETRETGEVPQWRQISEDPRVDEDIRKRMKQTKVELLKTRQDALKALKTLNELRQIRGLLDLSDEVVARVRSKKMKPDDLLNYAGETFTALRQSKSVKNTVVSFGTNNNATPIVKAFLEGRKKRNFLPTGFDTFDRENGGITYKALFTIGATSGGGKSALASQLAINWARMGETVALVPLEMTEEEQSARILANISSIDIRSILYDKMTDVEKVKLARAYKKFVLSLKKCGGSYKIFKPDQDMNIEEILASIAPLNAGVVIIDYISLLKGVDGDDSWQKLGSVARYCKVWADNNNKIVVLIAQVGDDGKIRYSGAIGEHSTYSWTWVSTKQTRENELLSIEQLKCRNGSRFPFNLRASLDTMQIRDLEQDERQEVEARQQQQMQGSRKSKNGRFKKKRPGDESDGAGAPPINTKKHSRDSYLDDVSNSDDED